MSKHSKDRFISYSPYTRLLLFSIRNHGVRFRQINCGVVDLWAWDNSCAWIPPTHRSAALQIGSDVGVRSLCMVWKWTTSVTTLDPNQNCSIGFDGSASGIAQSLACTRKLGKCRSSEGLRSFNPSKGTNLLILIILAGDIEMNPGPRSQYRLCKKYCKASENRLNVKNAKSAFTHHASVLTKRKCWN